MFCAMCMEMWDAVAGWLASRTLDPRVVSSNRGRSVTCGCVPGQNTLPLIARVFSDRTLKIVGPFYLVSMPGEVKDPTRVIYNVTRSGITNPSISWRHWLWASCAHHRLRSAVLHDTNMGARPLRYYAVGCLTTSRHKVVCRVYYRNRNRDVRSSSLDLLRAEKRRCQKKKSLMRLPPDDDCLKQHITRANFLAHIASS